MSTIPDPAETARPEPEDRLPSVTVVMPVRNEIAHIEASTASVLAFDYPADRLELFVVDGMSDDGTRAFLEDLVARHPRVKLLDNPDRLPAQALNKAIGEAGGEVILRVDGHSVYPADYARLCIEALLETKADNVGGVCITVPGADTPMARAIAYGMSHPFGVGNVRFRTGVGERCWVDTVPFGCWWRSRLLALGGFATDLPYVEDDEFNARLRQNGGRILLDPAIQSRYIARPTLRRLVAMLYRYGRNKPLAVRRIGQLTTWRQLIPPAFVAVLVGSALLVIYVPVKGVAGLAAATAHLGTGTLLAARASPRVGRDAALRLPVVFLSMHLAYGFGYLLGVLGLLRSRGPGVPRSTGGAGPA